MSMQQATRRCAMRQSRWHIPPIRLRLCLIVYSTLFLVYKFHGLKSSAALGQLADEPDFFGRAFPANFKLRGAEIHSFPPGTKIFVPSRDPRVQIRILRARFSHASGLYARVSLWYKSFCTWGVGFPHPRVDSQLQCITGQIWGGP